MQAPGPQHHHKRAVLLALTGVFAAVSLTACSPATSSGGQANTGVYTGATYRGAIETVAVVMGQSTADLSNSDLRNQLLSTVKRQVLQHPYYRTRFDLVDRQNTESLIRESTFGRSGYVARGTAPQLGQLLGARYILYVELDQASAKENNISLPVTNLPGGAIPSVDFSSFDVRLAVNLALVNAETGRVVAIGAARETAVVPRSVVVGQVNAGQDVRETALLDRIPDVIAKATDNLARDYDSRK